MSQSNSPKPSKRRGIKHPENYKRNIIKQARTSGSEYVGYDGNIKLARNVGPPCRYVKHN